MKNKTLIIAAVTLFLTSCTISSKNNNWANINQFDGLLFFINKNNSLGVSSLKQRPLIPSVGYDLPTWENLLPNAQREYRSGIHMGIDFTAPLGHEIRSSFSGVVVRSNKEYKDVDIQIYNSYLKTSAVLGKTPEDIYSNILLGKAVVIDHGYSVVNEYRVITVYAHLSEISDEIFPGAIVNRGQIIGKSGNTGTSSGALKNDKGSHLHWEMHFDNKNDRYYLGQNISGPTLYQNLKSIFVKE